MVVIAGATASVVIKTAPKRSKGEATGVPKIAALVAAVPNIKTGTRSGSANNGNKTPPRLAPKESAALTPPIRLSAGVPSAMLKIRTGYDANGILYKIPIRGEKIKIGNPEVNQWAESFAKTIIPKG